MFLKTDSQVLMALNIDTEESKVFKESCVVYFWYLDTPLLLPLVAVGLFKIDDIFTNCMNFPN